MAYAGALFADACLRGLNGERDVIECTFVESTVTAAPFFASKVRLGTEGACALGVGVVVFSARTCCLPPLRLAD